jgi:hypothetical protein
MEAASFSEMQVPIYQTTQCDIQKAVILIFNSVFCLSHHHDYPPMCLRGNLYAGVDYERNRPIFQ